LPLSPVLSRELSETDEGDLAALPQDFGDRFENRVDGDTGFLFAQPAPPGDAIDELLL
jgi:hypothetical protein